MTHHETNENEPTLARNIDALLRNSYSPEEPPAQFARLLEERLLTAAVQGGRSGRVHRPAFGARLAATAVAAALLVGLVVLGTDGGSDPGPTPRGPARVASVDHGANAPPWNPDAMTPRPRGDAPDVAKLAVGDEIRTDAGERRLLSLPDGSTLFVNGGTTATLETDRTVRLDRGEVYVEVAHDPSRPFTVKTEDREVTAVGTKFAVTAPTDGDTSVLVTQGRVRVSGLDRLLHAGEQLDPSGARTADHRVAYELGWTRDLMAAAESPLVPASDYRGGALVTVDPWGQEARLSLRRYHVDVHIEDGFARTTIDQTYFNHARSRMEGTFYFPLPADASLSRLAMYVAGDLMEGGMAERSHARNVYEQIRFTRRDPALLEWVGGSTFKMRVFPLEPREEKRIVLSYTQRLAPSYGWSTYRFPAGHTLQVTADSSTTVRFARSHVRWESDTPGLLVRERDDGITLSTSARGTLLKDDFVLRFESDETPRTSRWSEALHEGSRYLMLRHLPGLPTRPRRSRRDWVFLVESAGDRDPVVARVQIDVVREMLDHAEEGDTFSILTASTRVRRFKDGPSAVTGGNIADASAFLEGMHLVGALDLGNALSAATASVDGLENPVLVHVGSGVATIGERDPATLAKRVPKHARYVGVAVGKRWSRPFMRGAALRTGGHVTQIHPDETVRWRVFDLVSTLDSARLLETKVVDDGESLRFLTFDDGVRHGDEIAAVVRLDAGEPLPSAVTVTGRVGGETFTELVPVHDVAKNADYLPRMWAKLEIDRLLAEGADDHRRRVVELSKAMYVMSPYTSLLVLENDAMYEQFKVDRGRKDHWALYPCPDKIPVVREPLAARGTAQENQDGTADPVQVLDTILVRMPTGLLYRHDGSDYVNGTWTVKALTDHARAQGVSYVQDFDVEGADRGRTFSNVWRLPGGGRLGGVGRRSSELDLNEHFGFRDKSDELVGKREFAQVGLNLLRDSGSRSNRVSGTFGPRGQIPWQTFTTNWDLPPPTFLSAVGTTRLEDSSETRADGLFRFDLGRQWGSSRELAARSNLTISGIISTVTGGSSTDGDFARTVNENLDWGYASGTLYQRLVYQRARPRHDARYFSDLVSFAPGMNTTRADVQAVLDDEARPRFPIRTGTTDPAARDLVERARSGGWSVVTVRSTDRAPDYRVHIDGAGRFRYRRTLDSGLTEEVTCDGKTLVHLYRSIGLGARRTSSRFHRAALTALTPWFVPPVEDLLHGADVIRTGEKTIEVVAHDVAGLREFDDRLRMTFGEDGRLVRRQIVKMPSGEVVISEEYFPTGEVVARDGKGREVHRFQVEVEPAQEPNLRVDEGDLVVLPLPYRTVQHVLRSRGIKSDNEPAQWTASDTPHLLAAAFAQNPHRYQNWIGPALVRKGDRRIGWLTLLLSGDVNWDPERDLKVGQEFSFRIDSLKWSPATALGAYLEGARRRRFVDGQRDMPRIRGDLFLEHLAELATLHTRWMRTNGVTEKNVDRELQRALDFAWATTSTQAAWTVTSLVLGNGRSTGTKERQVKLNALLADLETLPGLAYGAGYERAGIIASLSGAQASRAYFTKLYSKALEAGYLPRIDYRFRNALSSAGAGSSGWETLVRNTLEHLLEKNASLTAVALAQQCVWLGDPVLAEEVLNRTLASRTDDNRLSVTVYAAQHLTQNGKVPRADRLLRALLRDPAHADNSALWRLASRSTTSSSRALDCLERALEIDYAVLPDVVNLQTVRSDHGRLLARFVQVSDAAGALLGGDGAAGNGFVTRLVRAADRWRAIDPDDSGACTLASRALMRLGREDLAWDYLTTPLALRPNESEPWTTAAAELVAEGLTGLAGKAYSTAFEIEPTNPQILWDHASLLRQTGERAEADHLCRVIADGKWQPRFDDLQRRARGYLRVK